MNKRAPSSVRRLPVETAAPEAPSPFTAVIHDVDGQHLDLVDANGHRLQARMSATLCAHDPESLVGREAVLAHPAKPGPLPVALDLLGQPHLDRMDDAFEAQVDGREVVIAAERRLELRCGKGSIVVDADGRITVRGTHLLSRSTGPIRIKGGHVDIN